MQAFYPDATAYDLTGCRLTQTLYYVSEGIPVLVTRQDGKKELILGYDSASIWFCNAEDGVIGRKLISDAETEYGMHNSRYTAFLQ